jgi:PAS domain S-box-containing protein
MNIHDLALIVGTAAVVCVGFVLARLFKKRGAPADSSVSSLASSLRNEKIKSDIVLNAIDDGVLLFDNQEVIQHFNPAAFKITGWPANEAIGLSHHSVIKLVNAKGEAYTDDQDPFRRLLKEGKPIHDNNAILVTRSNKQQPISLSISPLVGSNNTIEGGVAVFRDVSQERAEQQQRAEFISTASHEMRTPVAAIEGYLSLALNDKVAVVDSRAREYLEKAHASTQHLGQLFQDLLTSAKAEDGRLSNHPEVVEMGSFMEQLSDDLRFTAEKKGLFVDFVIGASESIDARSSSRVIKPLYYIFVDPDRLREVITNLFDNAVKYTDEGHVSLGLTGDANVVQIYVRDTGHGIPTEDIPHLFQKFYRVDSSATRTIGGTGLGLFICRKIIELYQGRVWVESELEKGSTFYINLPRLDSSRANQLKVASAQPGELHDTINKNISTV